MIVIMLAIILGIIACALWATDYFRRNNNIPTNQPQEAQEEIPQLTVIADGLEVPWDLTFLPDGNLLVTERPGRVQYVDVKTGSKKLLLTLPDVLQNNESGLHGITIHPNFSSNHYVYLYYTYDTNGSDILNKVVRYTYTGESLDNPTPILEKIPGAGTHDGGRIRFGPDNFLYVATGDAANPSQAQDINSLAGKILRVTDTGDKAPNNPFDNKVYSFGHRNPQGLTWDQNGNLWAPEHGPQARDELNLIKPGQNYGWPQITGDATKEGMITPKIQSGNTTWAPSGAAFLNGSVYFVGLRSNTLFDAVIENGSVKDTREYLVGQLGRLRGATVGPDSLLYITTSNRDGRGVPSSGDDKIIRVNTQKL